MLKAVVLLCGATAFFMTFRTFFYVQVLHPGKYVCVPPLGSISSAGGQTLLEKRRVMNAVS